MSDDRDREIEDLRLRLEEVTETLRAIREGGVDAVVVGDASGPRVYTLYSADRAYRLWVEQMTQGAATLADDGTITYCNPRLATLLGVQPERLVGRAMRELLVSEDLAWFDEIAASTREAEGKETFVLRTDGALVPVMLTLSPLPPDSGVALGVLVTDLTAQRHHEQLTAALDAVQKGKEQFHSALRQIAIPTLLHAEDGEVLLVNEAWTEITGYRIEDIPTIEAWTTRAYGERRDVANEYIRTLFESRVRVDNGEWDVVTATGARRTWQFYATPVGTEPDGRRLLVSNAIDVTERKRAERDTARRAVQVRRLVELPGRISAASDTASVLALLTDEARALIDAHQAVAIFAAPGVVAHSHVSLSERYAAWRGYQPDTEICGLVSASNRAHRMTQAELEARPDWRGSPADAPPLRGWLAAPLVGRAGQNVGMIQLSDKADGEFTADDEAMLLQLALVSAVAYENARLVEDLRDADRRKDEFLATLAHELRNPLAPVRTGLQVLKLAPPGDASHEKTREMMERQLGHMVRMIDDLLDVSRITRGKVDLRRERVELRTILASALETSRPLIEGAGHRVTLTLPHAPVFLDADVTRLAQVFSNLVNNAAKYTPERGHVDITARVEGDDVVVAVRDDGVGIPPEMLGRVFDVFTQVNRSNDRSQGGLGIGLTLVRRLLELHGGSIVAASEGAGRGSTFTVRLPICVDAPALAPVASVPSEPPRKLKVLVVDDNVDGAESLTMLLDMSGHEARMAHTGAAALDQAGSFDPDVVFLDIGLPGMDGYEVARRFRADPALRRARLVALTGWGAEDDRRRSKDAGFDEHLTKPVSVETMSAVLAQTTPG